MSKALIRIGLSIIFVVLMSFEVFAQCEGDLDNDGDVDGTDVAVLSTDYGRTDCETGPACEGDIYPINFPDGVVNMSDLEVFAADFGRTDCPVQPLAPLNLFNIGNSIGEGEAAYDDIGQAHHETVWSTGFDPADFVFTLNERFEAVDPVGFHENNITRDNIYSQAVSGATMADFITRANAVVAAAGATPAGTVGMVTIFLGSNDVCADNLNAMTDPALFEVQYRAGLDVLVASAASRNAYIHVSSIPAIYWLWNAKRSDLWCLFVWRFVPCDVLLSSPANDCGSGDSHLDPDTIHIDDGPNCERRKLFHAAIRDVYNPILKDVLMEYKINGLLPNAYFVDIFDIQFQDGHVNDGDCFHPSEEGHEMLAEEQWCRSSWNIDDRLCTP